MLIVHAVPSQDSDAGHYYYRTKTPGKAMARAEGAAVVNLANVHRQKDPIMRKADVLVLENVCDPDLLPLIRERKLKGELTVCEISDDIRDVHPWNPVYFFYQNQENYTLICRLASFCDALQVTSPELKRVYGHLNDHCEVFPNQISFVPPKRTFEATGEIVVGWGGSHGHLEDMAVIAGPLMEWIRSRQDAVLHLMCSAPIRELFDSLPAGRMRWTPPGTIDDYYRFLSKIDVGIGMLRDTPFNRSRSDVKFLEYAVSEVVPVMSCLEPYTGSVLTGKTGFLFKDAGELTDVLEALAGDRERIRDIAGEAREYVLSERLQEQRGGDRVDFYRNLIDKLHGGDRESLHALESLEEWSGLEGSTREGTYLELAGTRFESLLHDGLVMMQTTQNGKVAQKLFEEASKLEPENYLPFLYGSHVSSDPISWLHRALELKPDSLRARVLLGERFAESGEWVKAFECFESAAGIFPDYEVPYLRSAGLLERLNQRTQADALYEKVEALRRGFPKSFEG